MPLRDVEWRLRLATSQGATCRLIVALESGRHISKWRLTLVLSQSGRHSRMFLVRRSQRNVVQLKFSIQRSAADSEHSSSECFIASRLFENSQYGHSFQIRQGRGGEC